MHLPNNALAYISTWLFFVHFHEYIYTLKKRYFTSCNIRLCVNSGITTLFFGVVGWSKVYLPTHPKIFDPSSAAPPVAHHCMYGPINEVQNVQSTKSWRSGLNQFGSVFIKPMHPCYVSIANMNYCEIEPDILEINPCIIWYDDIHAVKIRQFLYNYSNNSINKPHNYISA